MHLVFGLLIFALASAAHGLEATGHFQVGYISYPQRAAYEWTIENAYLEANKDFAAGTQKLYWSGTRGVSPAGLTFYEARALRFLPKADGGMGCVVSSQEEEELRKVQADYASAYNKRIAALMLLGSSNETKR